MQNKKLNQGGFIQLIVLIVLGLLAMRYYHLTLDDVIKWIKSLNADKIVGMIKDLVDWCANLLKAFWGEK